MVSPAHVTYFLCMGCVCMHLTFLSLSLVLTSLPESDLMVNVFLEFKAGSNIVGAVTCVSLVLGG